MTATDPGDSAAVIAIGHLKLTELTGHGFRSGNRSSLRAEVTQPRTVVGRSEDADLTVVDPSESVSRCHAIIECNSGGWWIYDWSTNGTLIESTDHAGHRRSVKLPHSTGERLSDGMQVWLANTVVLGVNFVRRAMTGTSTEKSSDEKALVPELIGDENNMRRVALALTQNYRRSPQLHRATPVDEIATEVNLSVSSVWNRLRDLADIPAVRVELGFGSLDRHELAEVIARLYPNFVEPRSGADG